MKTRSVADLLEEEVSLEVECVDWLYLNGYVPALQHEGGVMAFFRGHRGKPIVSPALMSDLTGRFVKAVKEFAQREGIPVVDFKKGERKDEVAKVWRRKRPLPHGVVFIGIAQEKDHAWRGVKGIEEGGGRVSFGFARRTVCVNHVYFYINDREFGEMFIKVSTYFPFAVKVCLNGHEWVKRQLEKKAIAYGPLDNGFLHCAEPGRLQRQCDALSERDIENVFRRWVRALPWPLTAADRAAGFGHQLSIRQMEVSLTQVMREPRRGREFFEAVIRDNLDLGRPERVALVVDRKIRRDTPGRFATRVITRDIHPSLHISYKHTDLKQYYKEGRALRTETTFNESRDFGVGKGLKNFSHLRQLGRNMNRRLLEVEKAGPNCVPSQQSLQRLTEPTIHHDGQRAPGLRFGQPRVMALFAALLLDLVVFEGVRNRTLRQQVAALLGVEDSGYTSAQMSYDLRRLRLKGLIARVKGTHRYVLTPYGLRSAAFLTRLHQQVIRGAMEAVADPLEVMPEHPLRPALQQLDKALARELNRHHLAAA
jgi:hypothetical protein